MTLRQRAQVARSEYQRHPSRARLRTYLRLKARLGRWDYRFCHYYGVPVPRNDGVKDFLTRAYAAGLVPTATTNGVHAPTSYHKLGQAGDVGLVESEIGTALGLRRMERFQKAEFDAFCKGRRKRMLELIGPTNFRVVLRAEATILAEGTPLENQHDNHVHGAFTNAK